MRGLSSTTGSIAASLRLTECKRLVGPERQVPNLAWWPVIAYNSPGHRYCHSAVISSSGTMWVFGGDHGLGLSVMCDGFSVNFHCFGLKGWDFPLYSISAEAAEAAEADDAVCVLASLTCPASPLCW